MNKKSISPNFVIVKKLSREKQIKIYMRQPKIKLAEMLYDLNSIVDEHIDKVTTYIEKSEKVSNKVSGSIIIVCSILLIIWAWMYVR